MRPAGSGLFSVEDYAADMGSVAEQEVRIG